MDLQQLADVAQQIGQAGGWPIAILLILLLAFGMITGRLVPSSQAKDIRADRAARLAVMEERVSEAMEAADLWHEAHDASERARNAQAQLLSEVLAGMQTPARWNGNGRGRHADPTPQG